MYVGPDIVDDGLVFAMDAGSERTYPRNNLGVAWVDYGGGLAAGYYSIVNSIQPYSILLNTTYSSWLGYFGLTVPSAEDYTLMFDYVADATSVLILDNDGVDDNNWNATINVTTSVQTYNVTKAVSTTGAINFFIARNSGGNITVSNFRFFKSAPAFNIINSDEGTLTNGVGFSTDNGGLWDFDGVNDYVDAGDINPTTAQTLSAWVKLDLIPSSQSSSYPQIIGKRDVDLQRAYFFSFQKSINKVYWEIKDNAGTYFTLTSSKNSWTTTEWYCIDVTFKGSTGLAQIYINGILDNSTTWSLSYVPQTTATCRIGGGSYWLDGKISTVKIYDTALTSTELLQNYNAQKSRFI